MKKYIIFLLLIAIISCGKNEDIKVAEETNRLVRYTVVDDSEVDTSRRFAGLVQSDDQFKLSFRVSGTLEDLYFNIGDRVKKGETLARLDNETYTIDLRDKKANYESAKADILKAKADLKNSENEYIRIEQLYFEDSVSKSDYDIAKSNYTISFAELERANASLIASEVQVENSELQRSYTRLVSSVDGYIVSEEAKVDETISAGTPVYTISPVDDLKVITSLPESLITKVTRGDLVDVTLNTINDKVFTGTIVEVGKAPINTSSNYPVKIKIDTNEIKVKSGMSAKIDFKLEKSDNRVYIPLSSISEDHTNKTYIYKIIDINGNQGVAKKVYINTGSIEKDGIEALNDINSGDHIITAGITQIKDGQKVRIEIEEVI